VTNRERDSAARLFLEVADRLRAACQDDSASPHAAAARCGSEAHAIESLVMSYLSPKPRRIRGKR
jgi:hypothetical protein